MRIALIYNIRHVKPSLSNHTAQEEAEFDSPETIEGIRKALESINYTVELIETNSSTFNRLLFLKNKIDLAFNYSEGVAGQDREAQVPAMLEALEIPYTGSRPLTSAILLDKARTKEILSFYGLPTPGWKLIRESDLRHEKLSMLLDKALENHISFPLFVKPNLEGSSKGIFNDSVVLSRKELLKVTQRTLKDYKHGVLIENYLGGREFTVAMLQEKGRWKALPIIEVRFDELPKEMHPIDSYEVKWIYDSPEKEIDPLVCPAKISSDLVKSIESTCIRACESLEIFDWCRIDLRLDGRGEPNILEINSPPGIMPNPKENARYPRAARTAGINFPDLLDRIIKSAVSRYK